MKTFDKFLRWFNEKKTIIGLLTLSILQIDGLFDPEQGWYKVVFYVAGILAAGGLSHKAKKALKK